MLSRVKYKFIDFPVSYGYCYVYYQITYKIIY